MKIKQSLLFLFVMLFSTIVFAQKGKKQTLFNGKDLSGWKIYGTEKWYVEDGLLICESGPDKEYGYLGTEKSFKNFELTLEFKQEANGNSGVFFHSSIEGTKISGWQVEVAPPGHSTGGVYESYKRGWLIKPEPEKDKALKMGEWNKMRIVVENNVVTSYLNGTQMITLDDSAIGSVNGIIALQIHSGGGIKVKWRKIKVKEL
ncbi:3-keto-disaccharide hydrolase [Emticicia sp. SJ17W-69]|uniref:3-keto-disaccharide hydrolase n=1 Tax=Emticicia sp. SJ17W-69 TaxID=3421657 RepID=UPI003EB864DB